MAHAIETHNGVSFAAFRTEPAWHGLGTVFTEHLNTAEMLDTAHLSGWNVRLEDIAIPDGYRAVSDNYRVVRTNPVTAQNEILAYVGDKYRPYQNESLFDFGDNLLDGGAEWESAGSIKDGRVVFGSLKIDRTLTLDPQGANDKTDSYVLVTSSHDGSGSITALVTPVRVVCQNTLGIALNGAKQKFSARHTSGHSTRVEDARHVLGLAEAYFDKFDALAQELFQAPMSNDGFDKLYETIYPKPDDTKKASLTRWEKNFDLTRGLYLSSETNANITGTKWGALNAITERLDYYRADVLTEGMMAAASGFEAGMASEKARILELVQAA
jgi:phage/plasmid-like protein (TIGR03299 family)